MMPVVTLLSKARLPIVLPIHHELIELPKATVGSGGLNLDNGYIRNRICSQHLTFKVRPSFSVTFTVSAPSTTWVLVRMRPSAPIIARPVPRSICLSGGVGIPTKELTKERVVEDLWGLTVTV